MAARTETVPETTVAAVDSTESVSTTGSRASGMSKVGHTSSAKVTITSISHAGTTHVPAKSATAAATTCAVPYRLLTTSDYKGAALCLATAFFDDPVCTYALDSTSISSWDPARRWALHLRTFECVVYAHILGGAALGVPSSSKGHFDAVALWMPPGKNMDDWLTLIRSGLWRLQWAYTKEGRQRFYGEFLPLLNATKMDVLGERDRNSWYLVYLATRKEARGRGLASQLIRWGTRQADEAGMPTYLESSHRGNVAYYRRLGFVVKRTISLRDGTRAEMDIMVREPEAGKV